MAKDGSRKTTYAAVVRWVYAKHMDVELLETLEADKPRPLAADASEADKAAHAEAEKEWIKRERKRRHDLKDLELKAPTTGAFAKLLEATETVRTREIFRKQYHDVEMKAKEEERAADTVQRDDQRRIFPLFDALYRERPHLAESAKEYHDGRKYRRSAQSPGSRKVQSAPSVAQEAPAARESPPAVAGAHDPTGEFSTAGAGVPEAAAQG